ncbi:MAG TPA: hypothetical protein VK092_00135, partial [Deinococcales bacterium]|nr:hypothetical protein [Deinococcales bacterium]
MATGIVALALDGAGAPLLAQSLSVICVVAYAALTVLFALRFLRFGRQALGDLLDHARGPGYFTWVAGTCVCGSQLLLLQGQPRTAGSLWLFGLILLLILTYVFFSAATLRRAKPRMGNSLNGAWLLAVVAMQSVALLGTQLSLAAPEPAAG